MTIHGEKVTGFIGGGEMAAAMIAGMTEKWGLDPTHIYVSDHKEARVASFATVIACGPR